MIARLVLALFVAVAPAAAQTRGKAPEAAPPAAEPPPAYEPQLLRLAEIMGALAFLRDLCPPRDGEAWRGRMAALLEAEAASGQRRERLAGAFNRGFRGFELTSRDCTPAAEAAIARYIEEGARLTREISSRYGG